MKLRLIALCSVFAALAGCSSTNSSGPWASAEPEASMAAPARAMVWLPPQAGSVVSVLEQRRANGVVQDIVLSGEAAVYGENKITVTAISNTDLPGKYAMPNQANVTQPSEDDIAQELSEKFPDIAMAIGETLERNAYGPFGYAVGKKGKIGCLYSWQTIGRSEPKKLFESSSSSPVSIRVKLCRSGANPMALMTLMRQLAMGGVGPAVAADMAYGHPAGYSAPGGYGLSTFGAGDALAASGLGGYSPMAAAPQYGTYNMTAGMGGYSAPMAGGVTYNAYPASAYGTQVAAENAPRRVVKKRVIRYAARPHMRRHYVARRQVDPMAGQPSISIPMPDGGGTSYNSAPQPSAAVYRQPVASGGGTAIPMP